MAATRSVGLSTVCRSVSRILRLSGESTLPAVDSDGLGLTLVYRLRESGTGRFATAPPAVTSAPSGLGDQKLVVPDWKKPSEPTAGRPSESRICSVVPLIPSRYFL